MTIRHERRRSFSETDKGPLDTAHDTFMWLVTGPHPVAVDGRMFGGLPDRPVPLDELRNRLLRRDCPMRLRDAVWAHLVLRSRIEGATWTVGCVGMALPALKATTAKLCARFAADHHDIDAAVLEGFLAELARIDLRKPKITSRLRWAAYRGGHAQVREALDAPMPIGTSGYCSAAPPPPFGHPDLVLLRAVADGVLTADEAELIGSTRLENRSLAEAAAERGSNPGAVQVARWRAERRLRAYLTEAAGGPSAGRGTAEDADVADQAVAAVTIATATQMSRTVTSPSGGPQEKSRGAVLETAPKSGVRGRGRTPSSSGHDSRSRRLAGPDATEEVRRCA